MLRGMIFDMDGTLGDTLPVCFAAFQRAFQACGVEITNEEIAARFGPTEEGIVRQLVKPEEGDDAVRIYRETYEREHAEICPKAFDGIPEIIEMLQRRGIRLGIATGKAEFGAWVSIRQFGFDGVFDAVEAGSDEGFVKPALLKKILTKWSDLKPEEIAYVGDVPWDADAARANGMKAILAGWNFGADVEGLKAKQPDAFFNSPDEFQDWIRTTL